MGARVLHPRCLGPVRRHQIPLYIRSTEDPTLDGTTVGPGGPDVGPQVKAISAKTDVTVVSMDTLGMWQEVGFLADIFQIFKHHGLSVDLVATSEANVTVTLDPQANALDTDVLDRLLHDLNQYCQADLIGSCAVVSLVGRHIRSLLSELGPAFEVFDEKKVHLVTQAASDLNMSFVVDEEQAPRLVRELHAQFFGAKAPDAVFGPRWQELVEPGEADGRPPDVWWRTRRDTLLSLADEQSPRYVYDESTIQSRCDDVQNLDPIDQVFYAIKANPHPEVLRTVADRGLGFECVSPGELDRVFQAVPELDPERVLFQPNFAEPEEYADAFDRGVHVTLETCSPSPSTRMCLPTRRSSCELIRGRATGTIATSARRALSPSLESSSTSWIGCGRRPTGPTPLSWACTCTSAAASPTGRRGPTSSTSWRRLRATFRTPTPSTWAVVSACPTAPAPRRST
jgi:diaminopimelate decarboxylase/aspartate kinase